MQVVVELKSTDLFQATAELLLFSKQVIKIYIIFHRGDSNLFDQ